MLALTCVLGGTVVGSAGAQNLFTLDTSVTGFGDVAVDASGTGYFAWVHSPGGSSADTPMFCKIPRGAKGCASPQTLSLAGAPVPPGGGAVSPNQMFALLPASPANTVYLVGTRYITNDLLLWTSSDGGVTFGAPTVLTTQNYYTFAGPTDALLSGPNVFVASFNPDLHFASAPLDGSQPPMGTGDAAFTPPGGSLTGSTLGLENGPSGKPVLAYSVVDYGAGTPPMISYYKNAGGDPNIAGNWNQGTSWPGQTPSLAGGPKGLFLLSEDFAPGSTPTSASTPDRVDVRHYDAANGVFGNPVQAEIDPLPNTYGGRMFQTPGTGKLLIGFPGPENGANQQTVQLITSTDGGAHFSAPTNVGLDSTFFHAREIHLAAANDGQGFMTFATAGTSGNGLQVADLQPPTIKITANAIIFVGGVIGIPASFNTTGKLSVSTAIINASALASTSRARCKSGRVLVRKRCISNSFGSKTVKITKPGHYLIKVAPNSAAKKALRAGKTLHVKATLTFKPVSGGKPVVKTINATVKGKKKH